MMAWLRYALSTVVVVAAASFWWWQNGDDTGKYVTATVETGTVSEVVSVSGFVEADNTAKLGFPSAGRISEIFVEEGNTVTAGELLATVGQSRLAAERRAAAANLTRAEASRDELVNGQTTEERAVTESTVAQARAAWEQTVATELQKVQNAETALRSNDLIAYANDPDEEATAPTVTGSYTCSEEGFYFIEVYRSGTNSGYSFTYEGLEEGVQNASVDQPAPLGECGLSLQFTAGDRYSKSQWEIAVPNIRSSTYTTFANALTLAEQQATENIQAAKDALALAEDVSERDVAAPRVEALIDSNANVAAAQAELGRIDALLADQSVTAPFAGMVTTIDKLAGEVVTTEPFMTLLAENAFTLIARIPEIDITKVSVGQTVNATFDANPAEPQNGIITFVNPIATEIDGVAYFETKIILTDTPTWLRAGLNADIDVVISQQTNVTLLPQRFIETAPEGTFVSVLSNDEVSRTKIETGLRGTDGMVEVVNLNPGTVVVAP